MNWKTGVQGLKGKERKRVYVYTRNPWGVAKKDTGT